MNEKKQITISSVGNIISVTIDENENIKDITIKDEMFEKDQKSLLEELIVSTLNTAKDKIKELRKESKEHEEIQKKHIDIGEAIENTDKDKMKNIMDDIASKVSMEYKDGKPVMSVSMDSIDPKMISSIIDMFNNKK